MRPQTLWWSTSLLNRLCKLPLGLLEMTSDSNQRLAVSGALWSMRGQFLPSAEWKRILVCPVYGGLTTWRAERGSVCRAARGAGRKTSSEERPPWTCQRSIKMANEWCRHTQAKAQVRQRIYVLASDSTPTDRSWAVRYMLQTTAFPKRQAPIWLVAVTQLLAVKAQAPVCEN